MIIGADFYKWVKIFNLTQGSGPSGPYLLKSANLSDVDSASESFTNLGLGSGQTIILTDSDFTDGVYTLTNPCFNFIIVTCNTEDCIIKLPPANEDQSFALSQGPIFNVPNSYKDVAIALASGDPLTSIFSPSETQITLSANSTADGEWRIRNFVSSLTKIDQSRDSGDIILRNSVRTLYVNTDASNVNGDIDGDGTINFPYFTLANAMESSYVVDATTNNPVGIFCQGDINEANLQLKRNVFVVGNNSRLAISSLVILDENWSSGGGIGGISNFSNVSFPAGLFFNFDASGAAFVSFALQNLVVNTSDNYTFRGTTNNNTQFIRIEDFSGLTNDPALFHIENMGGSVINSNFTNFELKLSDSGTRDFNITNLNLSDDITISSNSNSGFMDIEMVGSIFGGNTTVTTSGTSEISVVSKGNDYANPPTIDGAGTFFEIDVLQDELTITNGANVSYESLGNGVMANFIPSNYMPADPSVTGHLIGIDNAIGGGGGTGDLQDAYSAGSDAKVVLSTDRPVSFVNPVVTSGTNSVITPGTGVETTVNYANYGWTFTPTDDITIVALQYNDDTFVGTGTRQAGIYIRDTQELLGSDFISKTDPLDSSNIYRTKVLTAPITLTGGIEYVFVVIIPPTEIHHPNDDAVPDSEITITEARTSLGTHDPQPLQFPTFNIVVNNRVYAGSFQFNLGIVQEEFSVNDTDSGGSSLLSAISTTRGTSLAPLMSTVQINAISSPTAGLDVYDITIGSKFTHNGTAWIKTGTNGYARVFYLNSYLGNDAIAQQNGGSIGAQFLTYAGAVSYINGLSPSPSDTNRCAIISTGQFSEDFNVYPHIDVIAQGNTATFTGFGGLLLDPSWGSISGNASSLIENISFNMPLYSFDSEMSPTNAKIIFNNCNFGGTTPTIEGINNTGNPNIFFYFWNVNTNGTTIQTTDYNNNFDNCDNLNAAIFTSITSSDITSIIKNCYNLTLYMGDFVSGHNNIVYTIGCYSDSITLDTTAVHWFTDASSFIPAVFSSGATIGQMGLVSSTGGSDATELNPANFSPVNGPTWLSSSALGYIAGIDNALAKSYGEMYVSSNTRGTAFATAAFVKVEAGSPLGVGPDYSGYGAGDVSNFTFANGRLTYVGIPPIEVRIQANCTLVLSSGVSVLFSIGIAVNGSAILKSEIPIVLNFTVSGNQQAVSTGCLLNMSTNDYVELFASNVGNTGDKFVAQSLNFSIN